MEVRIIPIVFERYPYKGTVTKLNKVFWMLTGDNSLGRIYRISTSGALASSSSSKTAAIKPNVHLKETVKIIGGDGTRDNSFTISL